MGIKMTHANAAGRDKRITEIAYKIWQEEGQPEGRSEDHWARATSIIDAEVLSEKPVVKKSASKKAAPAKK